MCAVESPGVRKPRITFLCPTMTQPRFIKRVEAALAQGFSVQVLAFERGYYSDNKFPSEANVVCLGHLKDGNYLNRALAIPKYRKIVAGELKQFRPDICYSFGTDNLFLFRTLRKHIGLLIHEIGDLRVTDKLGVLQRNLLGFAEKRLLGSADRLVVTSDAFASHFETSYCIAPEKFTVLENKLSDALIDLGGREPSIESGGPIRVGLIGLLRYTTIFDLVEVVKEIPEKCTLDIWGDGPLKERLVSEIKDCSNIRYHRSYVYPNALPQIYSETDISFVVYDNSDINVRLALPNKLYESAYYGVPMIVATNTELWRQVEAKRIGFAVNPSQVSELKNVLENLQKKDLQIMQEMAISNLKLGELVDEGEQFFHDLKNRFHEMTDASQS